MDLTALRETIINADPETDWNRIGPGPYFTDAPDIDEDTFEQHDELAVLNADLSISVQWGMRARGSSGKSLEGYWQGASFPDESISVYYVDVFWHGSLVDRSQVVSVDGGRAVIPVGWRVARRGASTADGRPDYTFTYGYTRWDAGLADVVNGDGSSDWREYASRVGMAEGDDPRRSN
jgi:hypothetical protein